MPTFSDLVLAASCPRKPDRGPAGEWLPATDIEPVRELAFRYERLLAPECDTLEKAPIAVTPTQYRTNLGCAKARLEAWEALANPAEREVILAGEAARGTVHKVIEEPLSPSIISTGAPPNAGVWQAERVRAVAAAKALAWERGMPVDRSHIEYPACGIIREVPLTLRNEAGYKTALQIVSSVDRAPVPLRPSNMGDTCEESDQ